MSDSWATITSIVGIGAAAYSTLRMVLSNQTKAALKDIYETSYLKFLLYWDAKFGSRREGQEWSGPSDETVAAAIRHLEREMKRLEAELRAKRAASAAAINDLRQRGTLQLPDGPGSDSNEGPQKSPESGLSP
jgi:hypothetical protein